MAPYLSGAVNPSARLETCPCRPYTSVAMTGQELKRLHELVHGAQAVVDRPWEEGETRRPIEFFTDHLPEEGWLLGWLVVAEMRKEHPGLFASYDEQRLHYAALDCLLAAKETPSIGEIAASLAEEAESEDGQWLVSIALANASLDRPWAPVGASAALRRTFGSQGSVPEEQEEADAAEEAATEFAIFHHLQDRLAPPLRVIRFGDGTERDTKRLVSLLLVEGGARQMAVEQARAKAHYAVAVWSVLAPPERWHLVPDLASWFAQPDTHQEPEHKRFDPGEFISHEPRQGGAFREWAPYPLPEDAILAAPFEAFAQLERRPAQALLTATSALYAAARGSRSQLSAQIREARRSIECLCEPVEGSDTASVRKRWERLARHFDIWQRVADARAYTPEAIAELQARLINARNIGTHGADAALLDLGWTAGDRPLKYGQLAVATDLSLAALSRDLAPTLFAIGEALRSVWVEMRAANFDDAAFQALFAP
jgi:hypothetical protein